MQVEKFVEDLSESYGVAVFKNDDFSIGNIKGLAYSFQRCTDGVVGYLVNSQNVMYKVFTYEEILEEKKRRITEYLKTRDYIEKTGDVSIRIPLGHTFIRGFRIPSKEAFLEKITAIFGIWDNEGLDYEFVFDEKEPYILFDFSDDRMTPNYVWAVFTVLYKVR